MLVRPDDINKLLKNYIELIGDIKATVIVDNDGLVVASTLKEHEDLVMSALTAHLQKLSERIKEEADSGYFKNLTLEMEKQKFIFNEAGPTYLLLTVVAKDASVDEILKLAKVVAEKIDTILKGESVSLELPKIVEVAKVEEPKTLRKCVYKIVLVGDPRVGKTSLLVKFATDRFQSEYKPTLGVDVIKHSYNYDENVNVTFTAWDISGQSSFKKLRKSYYPNTDGFYLVYDVTSMDSFEAIDDWMEEIQQYGRQFSTFILVGNKIDLNEERVVSTEAGLKKAKEYEIEFYETSANTGEKVKDIFHFLGELILEKRNLKCTD